MLSRLPTRCPQCREKFTAEERGLRLHPACVDAWIEVVKAKQRAKQAREVKVKVKLERVAFKKRKEAVKRRSQWEDECRRIVQRIARIRDRNDGCISCHLPATWDGQWHGSHFRSHGACSVLQFNLWNIHKACSSCNRDKGGNIINYRPRLIEKVGAARVDWLECQNGTFKPPIDYYIKFKRVMGKRLRRLERATTETP